MTLDARPLHISVGDSPGATMLVVCGEVDIATAAQLRDALLRHLAAAKELLLDLEGVTFMDSSGLQVLLASQRRAALLGNQLVITRASSAVERLLQITGTTALFGLTSQPDLPAPH
jgi:anti-anti-sigma factor